MIPNKGSIGKILEYINARMGYTESYVVVPEFSIHAAGDVNIVLLCYHMSCCL